LLIDTHCHLNFKTFKEDRNAVVQRASAAGVTRILNPGIDLKTSLEAIQLAQEYPLVYAAIGVHPNDALSWNEESRSRLLKLAQERKVVAVGEIGLDYYRDRAPRELQVKIFKEQLELAGELEIPVVIHSRNKSVEDQGATEDICNILETWWRNLVQQKSFLVDRPGVLHSYSGNLEYAKKVCEYNFMIGITGPITFPKALGLRKMVSRLSVGNLLIETDAPFLTPQPFRGKRNEPSYVRFVIEELTNIFQLPFEEIADLTTSNAERLFNWNEKS